MEKCFFDAVGGNGVFVNNYNRHVRVYGNKFTEAGDSAVCLVGAENLIQGTSHPVPEDNLISNNLIHDCGVFGKQIAGVFMSVTLKNTISHNLIYNLPRAGILLNDGWGAATLSNSMKSTIPFGKPRTMGRSTPGAGEGFGATSKTTAPFPILRVITKMIKDYVFYYPEEDGDHHGNPEQLFPRRPLEGSARSRFR